MSGMPTTPNLAVHRKQPGLKLMKYWWVLVIALFSFIFLGGSPMSIIALLFLFFLFSSSKRRKRRKTLAGLPADASKEAERLTRRMDIQSPDNPICPRCSSTAVYVVNGNRRCGKCKWAES